MTRESIDTKARRYLSEGRVTIEHADAETVRASARGSDAVYLVGYGGGVWACNCPSSWPLRAGRGRARCTEAGRVTVTCAHCRRRLPAAAPWTSANIAAP